jgi:DNA invertase Pin-like site-specific DNA recombinase
MKKFIAYYRVSRKSQGESGLGIAAQKSAVQRYIETQNGIILHEYTEVETGTNKKQRVVIHEAINQSKKEGAILVIAKIDRLARNVNFVSSLMDAGVEFVACDMPSANHFTIHIFAALAEQEAKLISQRTRHALSELKKRGVKLGKPENLTNQAREKGQEIIRLNARNNDQNRQAQAVIVSCRERGMTLRAIAEHLNQLNFKTRYGNSFHPSAIKRLLEKAMPNLL